jgi:hypothetical protein
MFVAARLIEEFTDVMDFLDYSVRIRRTISALDSGRDTRRSERNESSLP